MKKASGRSIFSAHIQNVKYKVQNEDYANNEVISKLIKRKQNFKSLWDRDLKLFMKP